MKICVPCRQEMTCKKNGVAFVWGEHAYSGDVYECKSCGQQTGVTGGSWFFPKDKQEKSNQDLIVRMGVDDGRN